MGEWGGVFLLHVPLPRAGFPGPRSKARGGREAGYKKGVSGRDPRAEESRTRVQDPPPDPLQPSWVGKEGRMMMEMGSPKEEGKKVRETPICPPTRVRAWEKGRPPNSLSLPPFSC